MSIFACELPPVLIEIDQPRIVLLWGQENLLGVSVKYLLGTSKMLEIKKLPPEMDETGLIATVWNTHPEVVVIYPGEIVRGPIVANKLMQYPGRLKVVLVNLESNAVQVFSKQEVFINEGADLLSIVEGCPQLACKLDRSRETL